MSDKRDPERNELTPDLAAFECRLAQMTPAAPRIERDRLMFEAGRAAASRPGRPANIGEPSWLATPVWPVATALMTAACLFLATMVVWQRQSPPIVSRPPSIPSATPVMGMPYDQTPLADSEPSEGGSILHTTWPTRSGSGYLGVRNVALTRGLNAVDMLTSAKHVGGSEPANGLDRSQRKMLTEWLPSS